MKNPPLENEAFSAGLIHDAGKLVLDKHLFEKKEDFERLLASKQKSVQDAERELFGFDHADLAYKLCGRWNITDAQSLAIKYHHCPLQSQDNQLAYILYIADLIALVNDSDIGNVIDQAEIGAIEFIGLAEKDLIEVQERTNESVEKISQSV